MVDLRSFPLKKPHPVNHRAGVAFAALAPSLPPAPAAASWYQRVEAAGGWGMLCNDRIGDCAEAAQLHGTMLRTAYAGTPLVADNADAVALYSHAAGYDPARPETDQGTQIADLMAYTAGNPYACGGGGDQLAASAWIDPNDIMRIRQAIAVTGSVLMGVQLPAAWENAMVWDAVSGDPAGGHAILLVGYDSTLPVPLYDVITWGMRVKMTEAGLRQRADEAWVMLDWDWLRTNGADPNGLTRAAYAQAFAALKG